MPIINKSLQIWNCSVRKMIPNAGNELRRIESKVFSPVSMRLGRNRDRLEMIMFATEACMLMRTESIDAPIDATNVVPNLKLSYIGKQVLGRAMLIDKFVDRCVFC